MDKVITSKKKIDAISNGIFIMGLGLLFFTKAWWPGIFLAFWAAIAAREYLTGRNYDLIISTILLIGLYFMFYFDIQFANLLIVLFVMGALYIIIREYMFAGEPEGEDKAQEIEEDISDGKEKS